jgi:hypothetical protein
MTPVERLGRRRPARPLDRRSDGVVSGGDQYAADVEQNSLNHRA